MSTSAKYIMYNNMYVLDAKLYLSYSCVNILVKVQLRHFQLHK